MVKDALTASCLDYDLAWLALPPVRLALMTLHCNKPGNTRAILLWRLLSGHLASSGLNHTHIIRLLGHPFSTLRFHKAHLCVYTSSEETSQVRAIPILAKVFGRLLMLCTYAKAARVHRLGVVLLGMRFGQRSLHDWRIRAICCVTVE